MRETAAQADQLAEELAAAEVTLAEARDRLEQAEADISAAAEQVADALATAQQARDAVATKATILTGTAEPTPADADGQDEGTLWRVTDTSGTREWVLRSGQWQPVLPVLDVSRLTVTDTARMAQVAAEKIIADAGYYGLVTTDLLVAGQADIGNAIAQKFAAALASIIKARIENLEVTEGATISDAVIQKLSTQQISSREFKAIAADGSWSGMMPEGFLAYDKDGGLTLRLNGRDNIVTGKFATALTGPRVELSNDIWGGSFWSGMRFWGNDTTLIPAEAKLLGQGAWTNQGVTFDPGTLFFTSAYTDSGAKARGEVAIGPNFIDLNLTSGAGSYQPARIQMRKDSVLLRTSSGRVEVIPSGASLESEGKGYLRVDASGIEAFVDHPQDALLFGARNGRFYVGQRDIYGAITERFAIYSDGTGAKLLGSNLLTEARLAGNGSATTVARSDHLHDGRYAYATHSHPLPDIQCLRRSNIDYYINNGAASRINFDLGTLGSGMSWDGTNRQLVIDTAGLYEVCFGVSTDTASGTPAWYPRLQFNGTTLYTARTAPNTGVMETKTLRCPAGSRISVEVANFTGVQMHVMSNADLTYLSAILVGVI
ncbi:hypothetical protein CGZ93_17945 [Enemella dayhoffiae]|uniref:Uncharacterized protein n=1 Tax=Enemella dayhoffiae TaxID=2016507 RepID=A0A255GQH6_9ACTN|nr:hypothetical protein CGZ93_17945 [Enemella dayhoffiae]